jgi:hypothetical protein
MQAPPALGNCLQHVEPLPPLPRLEAAQKLLDAARAGVPLSAELAHFVGRAASLPPPLRARALASLEAGLAQRQGELLAPDAQSGYTQDPSCMRFEFIFSATWCMSGRQATCRAHSRILHAASCMQNLQNMGCWDRQHA